MQARAPFLWKWRAVLAVWMHEAWELRDARSDVGDQRSEISEKISDKPAAPQSLAERLRTKELEQKHETEVQREQGRDTSCNGSPTRRNQKAAICLMAAFRTSNRRRTGVVLSSFHWLALLLSPFIDPVSQGAKHPFYEKDPCQQVFDFPPLVLLGGERLLTGPKTCTPFRLLFPCLLCSINAPYCRHVGAIKAILRAVLVYCGAAPRRPAIFSRLPRHVWCGDVILR